MHAAEARIATDHANRYLTQLCRHAGKMGGHLSSGHLSRSHHDEHTPPAVLNVEWSDTSGAIRFGEGRCMLRASDSALLLHVEATTESALRRLQHGIAHRLETFGHRERLTVRWQPSTCRSTGQPEESPSRVPPPGGPMRVRWRSRLARNLALAAVAAVAIAAHLGLLGATLAIAAWTKWGATAILAFVVIKSIVTMGAHVAGGAFAFRQGMTFLTDGRQRHAQTQGEGEMAGAAGENTYSKAPGLVFHHAKLYDLTVWLMTLGRERALREKILHLARLKPGESVLDVGCGTGSLAIAAKQHVGSAGTVNGIDASPEMIARAERKAARACTEVAFRQAPAQALPFPDAQFDVVFTTVMLHHLSRPARERCAQEMRRVLKPGGHVVAVDFAPRAEPKGFLRRFHHHGHVRLDEIIAILGAAGLNVTESGALGFRHLQFALATTPSST
jgi:ubiquinone/menaquinone biosynthesis C-methylase UbiE